MTVRLTNNFELKQAKKAIEPYSNWRNNKHGTIYTVIGVGRDSEPTDGELLVKVAYARNGELWFRPWKLFLTKFTKLEDK